MIANHKTTCFSIRKMAVFHFVAVDPHGLFGVLTGKKLKIGVKGISIGEGGITLAVFVLKSHGAKRVVGYLCEARIAAICALALQGYV